MSIANKSNKLLILKNQTLLFLLYLTLGIGSLLVFPKSVLSASQLSEVTPQLGATTNNTKNQESKRQNARYTGIVKKLDDIAQQITVRNDSQYNGNGSGVIIAKDGQTYYVLTANHVVDRDEPNKGCQVNTAQGREQYHIVAPDGQKYLVNPEMITCLEGVDLAVVQFQSDKNYTVANLAKSELPSKSLFFVSGFPGTNTSNMMLTAGIGFEKPEAESEEEVIDPYSLTNGYELVYTNQSYRGMSGGPILDSGGRVIEIHCAAEGEVVFTQSGQEIELQLGKSLGVPIDTFLSLANKTDVKTKALKIENSLPPKLNDLELASIENQLFNLKVPQANASEFDWLNYGNQLRQIGRDKEAIADYTQAIKRLDDYSKVTSEKSIFRVEYADSYKLRAGAYFQLKNYPKAIADYSKAIELNPDPDTYYFRGLAYFQLKNYQKAIADYNKLIEIEPNNANSYVLRAETYFQLKDYQKAIADFDKAIELNPDYAIAYYERGITYYLLKDDPKAIADLQKALELFQQQGDTQGYQQAQELLRKLGASY